MTRSNLDPEHLAGHAGPVSPNPLFRWFPMLESSLPWAQLGDWPTPVVQIGPAASFDGELWVKRDDLSSAHYGGNKVRKLEYLLADAVRQSARRLITTGVVGSHHCLATAVHGARQGLPTSLVVFPQPETAHAREISGLNRVWADELRNCSSFATQPFVEVALRWRRWRDDPYVIPGGGSNGLGTLGHVGAALELAEQVRRGELTRPDTITVAAGTLGTVAGLAIGAAMTNLTDRIRAVRIVPSAIANVWSLSRLVESALRLLADGGAPVPDARIVTDRIQMIGEYLGGGYGHPTDAGRRAAEWFGERGFDLDPSYTAKTAAAFLDHVRDVGSGCHLYWHTLSAVLPAQAPAPTRS